MKKYAILTDSTSNIKNGTVIDGIKIYTVPLYIFVNNKEYKENETIFIEQLSKELDNHSDLRTSQPSSMDFIEKYTEMFRDGITHCIAIHASSNLSGTYQNSVLSSKLHGLGIETMVYDSSFGSYPLERMILNSIDFLNNKKESSWELIKKDLTLELDMLKSNLNLYVIPSNLKQLVKSGRANTTQLIATTLLNIKVILKFENGAINICDKVRTDKKIKLFINNLVEQAISENKKELAILYTNNKEECQLLIKELESKYKNIQFVLKQMMPVVAVHTGNGTIAVSF